MASTSWRWTWGFDRGQGCWGTLVFFANSVIAGCGKGFVDTFKGPFAYPTRLMVVFAVGIV